MKTVWSKGPPPSIGWWPASMYRDKKMIRWWDGKDWSVVAFTEFTAGQAADCANLKALRQNLIEWCDRWWL